MSELNYVELPVIRWLSGQGSLDPAETGLGWTHRDTAAMNRFERLISAPSSNIIHVCSRASRGAAPRSS